ncbi:hypothetical protein CDV36_004447 [Fusarium kuroshium]|uniref:Uncharacterized protein n=1 Tax=Fusarium kuroshium TaxID=2010991 RepID=A0A3M2SEB1_9HYPO|nr:hypothetical protein CDV36_004447 [Fusarium kuroshium]
MSDHQLPRPALLRQFGRCEPFHSFGDWSSHVSVATRSIGSMTVDCQFLFEKSQWGVLGLGNKRFPAGIIYMNLNFGPPRGCRVKSATVTVTLDEYDECLNLYKSQACRGYQKSTCPVQMTDWYGPKQLVGEERCTEFKQTMSVAPEVHVFGGGAGGIGMNSERVFKSSSRWSFNGQLLPGKPAGTYKTLKWVLTPNELERQSFRNSCVHTAFSFHHAGQPFLMKVEIEGKLTRWNERIGSKLKFKPTKNNRDGQATTLIDFREPEKFQKRLDELARSLPRAMELENYQDIPVEIPDTATVSFQSTSPSTEGLGTCEIESPENEIAKQKALGKAPDLPPLEGPRVLQGLENHKIQASQDPTEPTVENITRLIQNMTRPIEQQIIGRPPANSFSSTSNTVVAPEDEQDQMTSQKEDTKPGLEMTGLDANQEAMLKILQIPALLTILQLIATLMEMLGASSKAKAMAS